MTDARPRTILLICTNNLGDTLMFMPVAASLRARFPETRMTFLGRPIGVEAARLTGLFDAFLEADWEPRGPLMARPGRKLRMARRLREASFDLGLMASGEGSATSLLMHLGRVKVRVGFKDCRMNRLLSKRVAACATENEAFRNLRLLGPLGIPREVVRPPCEIPEGADDEAGAGLERALRHFQPGALRVLMHVGSSHPMRRWPPSHFAALSDRLLEEGGVRPVLLEGPAEAGVASEILTQMKHDTPIVKGPASLSVLAGMLRRCDLFVGTSSGPWHLSVLAGIPSVSLWGPTDPALWGSPYARPAWKALRSDAPCAPCETWTRERHVVTQVRGPHALCRTQGRRRGVYPCMADIDPDTVYTTIVDFLRTLRNPERRDARTG
jgi:heptosyltransferase-2